MKLILIIFSLLLLSPACLYTVHAETISGSGCSVSNVGYLSDLAKEYERLSGIKVFVKGGGSMVGIEDLRSGNVDFAASCRDRMLNDPSGISFVQVAWDALVFIVHRTNPVEDISLDEIRAMYNGQYENWKQLKGDDIRIKIFMSKSHKGLSGVESSIRDLALKGKEPVMSTNIVSLASSGIVEQMVEKTREGFASTGFSSARKRDVKMLRVNGVKPTKENIIAKKYSFIRPLYILLPSQPKAEVQRFIDYILSREGQQFISSSGAISLLDIQ